MKTQLTIADYFSRYRTGGNTKTTPRAVEKNKQHPETFENILAAAKQGQIKNKNIKTVEPDNSGMTLQDYLKNPLQIHFSSAKISENREIEENTTIQAKNAPGETEKSVVPEEMVVSSKNKIPAQNNENDQDIRQKIDACIADAAQKYNVSEKIIKGIIRAESGFQPQVVSHAGAQGLMQLMPGTAKELGVTDPFDIKENIDGGVRYFKQMLDQFDGDIKLSLAAYNAGPGTVQRYKGIPPYRETRQYVSKVIDFSKKTA